MHVLRVRMRVRALLLASSVHAGIRLKCQPFARDWRSLSHICTCHVHTRPPSHSHARTPPRLAPCTHARPCCCTEDCVDCARAREKAKCCVKESLRVLAKLAQNSSVSCGPSNASQMTLTKLLLPKCQHTHQHIHEVTTQQCTQHGLPTDCRHARDYTRVGPLDSVHRPCNTPHSLHLAHAHHNTPSCYPRCAVSPQEKCFALCTRQIQGSPQVEN